MSELYLIRHGSTLGNELRRYVGRGTDEPLSDRGRVQCAQLAPVLPRVDQVYVSPMLRARQTAELCFPEARLREVPGLEEFDFGAFEGKSARGLEHDERYRAWVDGWCMGPCPGGESRAAFLERSNGALLSLVGEAVRAGEQRLVVVAHGGTVMAAMHAFCHEGVPADDYFGWQVGPCEGYVTRMHMEGDALVLTDPRRIIPAKPATA